MKFEGRDPTAWRLWFAWRPVELWNPETRRTTRIWWEWVEYRPREDWWQINWCYDYRLGTTEYLGGYIPEG